MKFKKKTIILLSLISLILLILLGYYLKTNPVPVLDPKGLIGFKERNLIVIATLLMLIVVIPVLILTVFITHKYREDNEKATYTPDWDKNVWAEAVWWGLPFLIIIALSIVAWKGTHDLDPYKPIDPNEKPLMIQVVALQWKWLFIYPEQKIATINFVQFPERKPVYFEITADAPMNSFWIPQLGGQIYAMPGMKTQLHLIANETGTFRGSSANLSGKGFAGMKFVAQATSEEDFNAWVESVQHSPKALNLDEYLLLAKPSKSPPASFYKLEKEDLFNQVVMKFMMPDSELQTQETPKKS